MELPSRLTEILAHTYRRNSKYLLISQLSALELLKEKGLELMAEQYAQGCILLSEIWMLLVRRYYRNTINPRHVLFVLVLTH